jgi:hypothetical protein
MALRTIAKILAKVKSQLIADQKAVLEPRRDVACKELRESRDERYRELLDHQQETRAELRWRQEAGLDNALFFMSSESARLPARRCSSASVNFVYFGGQTFFFHPIESVG